VCALLNVSVWRVAAKCPASVTLGGRIFSTAHHFINRHNRVRMTLNLSWGSLGDHHSFRILSSAPHSRAIRFLSKTTRRYCLGMVTRASLALLASAKCCRPRERGPRTNLRLRKVLRRRQVTPWCDDLIPDYRDCPRAASR
jgi:hypothetical protein